jgi:predicted transcriptional regulator
MSDQRPAEKMPLTIQLSPEVARRLQMAAEARKLAPAALAADLLDRYLPRSQTSAPKGNIPYA